MIKLQGGSKGADHTRSYACGMLAAGNKHGGKAPGDMLCSGNYYLSLTEHLRGSLTHSSVGGQMSWQNRAVAVENFMASFPSCSRSMEDYRAHACLFQACVVPKATRKELLFPNPGATGSYGFIGGLEGTGNDAQTSKNCTIGYFDRHLAIN